MAAIYMWPVDEQVLLTTTLYPVDVQDGMELSACAVDEAGWWAILDEAASQGLGVSNGTLYTIRFDAPEQGPESAKHGLGVSNGTIYTIRFDAPEQGPESAVHGLAVNNALLVNVKVEVDTPDEKLEIICTIESDCTMSSV